MSDVTEVLQQEFQVLNDALELVQQSVMLTNLFFARLMLVMDHDNGSYSDVLMAYRDALLASGIKTATLYFDPVRVFQRSSVDMDKKAIIAKFGLTYIKKGSRVELTKKTSLLDLDLLQKVYCLERRRKLPEVPMDLVLKRKFAGDANNSEIQSYRGKGQKEAVRTALFAPEASTILVNLPTGVGKTLIFHALALLVKTPRKLTLIIVPTIALAIEQAVRAREMLQQSSVSVHQNYYYSSGLSDEAKQDVKDRIRSGQQRILFTSPEAARGSLIYSLFDAAQEGRIANIVVDEAHLIDQWGDEFRPDFQVLGQLIRSLIEVAGGAIKTLLLSATFTDANVEPLRRLFNFDGKPMIEVHSSFLRPEPQYEVLEFESQEALDAGFEQVVRELPRPLIIYCLLKATVNKTLAKLQGLGFQRVRKFTSDTSYTERESIINAWNQNRVDIIVATSAFGVGMDKADVRSILHVEMPENLDRFYQDVGRSGRDGCASQSVILFHRGQKQTAKNTNLSKLIKKEGPGHWNAMFKNAQVDETGMADDIIIDLNTRPPFKNRNKYNFNWNLNTLSLMQRAGLIEVLVKPPREIEVRPNNGMRGDEVGRDNLKRVFEQAWVKTLVDDHLDEERWLALVEPQRKMELLNREEGFNRLKNWLFSPTERPLCHILAEQYTVSEISPQIACGGCPGCRKFQQLPRFPENNFEPMVKGKDLVYGSDEYIYYEVGARDIRQFIRTYSNFFESFIERKEVVHVFSTHEVLVALERKLKGIDKFWATDRLESVGEITSSVATLIIVPPGYGSLPKVGYPTSAYTLFAPKDLPSTHFGRKWWEDYRDAREQFG